MLVWGCVWPRCIIFIGRGKRMFCLGPSQTLKGWSCAPWKNGITPSITMRQRFQRWVKERTFTLIHSVVKAGVLDLYVEAEVKKHISTQFNTIYLNQNNYKSIVLRFRFYLPKVIDSPKVLIGYLALVMTTTGYQWYLSAIGSVCILLSLTAHSSFVLQLD